MTFRNYNLNWQDLARLEKLEKKVNEIQSWLLDKNNIDSAEWSKQVRLQALYSFKIATIKKQNDPYKPTVYDTAIIIHPSPKR